MITSQQSIKLFGEPGSIDEGKYMMVWQVSKNMLAAFTHVKFMALGTIGFPTKIYCNKLLQPKLEKALSNVIERSLAKEKTTD